MAKYKQVKPHSWEQPVRKGYKMVCCDCGLVHTIDFRIFKGRVQMRAERDSPSTKVWRKQNGITVRLRAAAAQPGDTAGGEESQ